jgi:hypothetical protein
MIDMITRTIYVPANRIGRYIINYLVDRVSCSIGDIHKVTDTLAVPVTCAPKDVVKVERILEMYGLMETNI